MLLENFKPLLAGRLMVDVEGVEWVLWKCRCWLLHLPDHRPPIQDRERDNADQAERQHCYRERNAGRDDNVHSVWQPIPETMQDGDEEVGQDHGAGDAKAVRCTLAEQHSTKNAVPDPVAKRR